MDQTDAMRLLGHCRQVDHYLKRERIGEGSYGTVYRAKDKITGRWVALKKLKLHDMKNGGFPMTSIREIKILQALKGHPNIVSLEEVVVGHKQHSVFLVFEQAGMDLAALLSQMTHLSLDLPEQDIKNLVLQTVNGLLHIHAHFILHRDIKLSNLLLTPSGTLKIIDFGLSRNIYHPARPLTQQVVTLWYRPPEVLLTLPGAPPYDTAVDVWSLGCVFMELLRQGRPVFTADTELQLFKCMVLVLGYPTDWPAFLHDQSVSTTNSSLSQFKHFKHNQLADQLPKSYQHNTCLIDLLHKIFTWDPAQRITLQQVLLHPYFQRNPRPALSDEIRVSKNIHQLASCYIDRQQKKKKLY